MGNKSSGVVEMAARNVLTWMCVCVFMGVYMGVYVGVYVGVHMGVYMGVCNAGNVSYATQLGSVHVTVACVCMLYATTAMYTPTLTMTSILTDTHTYTHTPTLTHPQSPPPHTHHDINNHQSFGFLCNSLKRRC